MGADLSIAGWLHRESLLLMDECMVTLEHERSNDRIRKIYYERIQSLVTWRVVPTGRIMVALLPCLAGLIMLLNPGTAVKITGAVFLLPGILAVLWYAWCGKTFIRITRPGEPVREFAAVIRPGRLRRFLILFARHVERAQRAAAQKAEAREAERLAEESAVPPAGPTAAEIPVLPVDTGTDQPAGSAAP